MSLTMRATIQRVREVKKTTDGFLVSCKNFEIKTKKIFQNGDYVILLEGENNKLLEIRKMFDFLDCSEDKEIRFDSGDDVTEYIPAVFFD